MKKTHLLDIKLLYNNVLNAIGHAFTLIHNNIILRLDKGSILQMVSELIIEIVWRFSLHQLWFNYRQVSNTRHSLVGN